MMSIRELHIWIAEHLQTKLSVEDLADRMSMSVRNFERVFTREVGTTPSQYVLQMRVEAARRQLELTEKRLKQVASAAGFGNVDVMSRAFVRLLGITPRRYRELGENSICDDGRTRTNAGALPAHSTESQAQRRAVSGQRRNWRNGGRSRREAKAETQTRD
jgi:AraC-like DNA-binding protein